jgi:NNP family nitrate/nitrite transporter-like MFS transporter
MKAIVLLIFWSLWYLNSSTRTIIAPLLPVIEEDLAINHTLAGSISFFVSAGYVSSLFLSGFLSILIGYRQAIIIGLAVSMTALFCLNYATAYLSFVALSLFVGFGTGIYLPNAIPLITSIFGRKNWGKAIAIHDTGSPISFLSVPLLVALGLRFFQWRELFGILGVAFLIALISLWAFVPSSAPVEGKGAPFSSILRRGDFWIMAMLYGLAVSATLGVYNFIPLFLVKERGVPMETANTILGLSRFGGLFVAIGSGFLIDRYGGRKIMFSALLVMGLSTMGMSLARHSLLLVMMIIVQATVCPGFFPAALVAISRLTEIQERSTFTGGTVGIATLMGFGVTPVILGAVSEVWSFQIGILFLGIFITLSSLFLRHFRKI